MNSNCIHYFFREFTLNSLQCESGFIESPLSEINCWFFSGCWVRPHTSNHLCLPSRDWPVFWIRNFVYFSWPIRRRKTEMIRRVGANPAIWISPFCRFRVIWLSMIKDSYGSVTGVRSHFKVVVLAPSFCGESSFRVIRDLSECIFFRRRENESFLTRTWPLGFE